MENRRFFLFAILGVLLFLSYQTWQKDYPKAELATAEPKKLRRELAKELRGALAPAVQTARSSINAMGHSGQDHPSPIPRRLDPRM